MSRLVLVTAQYELEMLFEVGEDDSDFDVDATLNELVPDNVGNRSDKHTAWLIDFVWRDTKRESDGGI